MLGFFKYSSRVYNVQAGDDAGAWLSNTYDDLKNPPAPFVAIIEPGFYQARDIIHIMNKQLLNLSEGPGNVPGFHNVAVTLTLRSDL